MVSGGIIFAMSHIKIMQTLSTYTSFGSFHSHCLVPIPACAGMTKFFSFLCVQSTHIYLGPVVKPQDDIRKIKPAPRGAGYFGHHFPLALPPLVIPA